MSRFERHWVVLLAIVFSTAVASAQSTLSTPEIPGSDQAASMNQPDISFSLSQVNILKNIASLNIPKQIADREGFYPAPGYKTNMPNPVVIYILEAHTNYEVQKSIVSILQFLVKQLDSRLILVEGGVGDVSLAQYRILGDQAKRREVAEQFLKEGNFSAEEYLDLAEDLPLNLYGIENPGLYDENLIAFLRASSYREKASKFIQSTRETIRNLEPSIYSPDHIAYLKKKESINLKGSAHLLDKSVHLGETAKKRNISLVKAPLFERLLGMVAEESNFDFSSVSYERDQLIRLLTKKVLYRDLKPLINDWDKAQSDQDQIKIYLDRLVRFASKNGISDEKLKKFRDYRNYLDRAESLMTDKMMIEIDNVEIAVEQSFLESEDQKTLYQISKDLSLLDKLFHLEMTPEEFQQYKKRRDVIANGEWLRFLEARSGVVIPAKAGISSWMSASESFFKVASLRDQAMSENIYTKVLEENQPVSVLIAGGFHKDRLIKKMNQMGLSVLVLMPHFTEETDNNRYHELLKSKWEMRNW